MLVVNSIVSIIYCPKCRFFFFFLNWFFIWQKRVDWEPAVSLPCLLEELRAKQEKAHWAKFLYHMDYKPKAKMLKGAPTHQIGGVSNPVAKIK